MSQNRVFLMFILNILWHPKEGHDRTRFSEKTSDYLKTMSNSFENFIDCGESISLRGYKLIGINSVRNKIICVQ